MGFHLKNRLETFKLLRRGKEKMTREVCERAVWPLTTCLQHDRTSSVYEFSWPPQVILMPALSLEEEKKVPLLSLYKVVMCAFKAQETKVQRWMLCVRAMYIDTYAYVHALCQTRAYMRYVRYHYIDIANAWALSYGRRHENEYSYFSKHVRKVIDKIIM